MTFSRQALIFDLDGTLLDTEPLYTLATQRVFDEYGKVFTLEFKRTIVGREAKESAEMTVRHFDLPIDAETLAAGVTSEDAFPDAPAIEGQSHLSRLSNHQFLTWHRH